MVREVRVLFFGSAGVGKSALIIINVKNVFVDKYDPTIEDSYRKQVELEGQQYMLDIMDTAGTVSAMTQHYVKQAEVFVLVYSVTSRASFKELGAFRDAIIQAKGEEVPLVLVGNKVDLASERVVKTDEGKRLANEWKCKFVETSAKTKVNINNVLNELLHELEKFHPTSKKKEGWCVFI